MVVFVCGSCGESVKKAAVDKHCQTKCRNCHSLSCIDCGKDFPGETYRTHNQCMTEEEKWHGADFKPKAGGNTGQKKQDAWVESIQSAIPAAKTANPQLAGVLERLLTHENVPRKEAKFKNFLLNCMRIHNHQIVTAVWGIVASVKIVPVAAPPKPPAGGTAALPPKPPAGGEKETPPALDAGDPVEPAKKRARTAGATEDALTESTSGKEDLSIETPARKFRWKKEIREVLGQSADQSLSQKKLKKKVLQRYETFSDLREMTAQDDLQDTFDKYLRKYPDLFHVSEDHLVKLVST